MEYFLFLAISFSASAAGAVCGIGGGVIIKPVLDLCGLAGVSEISFLSGCTVLAMSCCSVFKSLCSGESRVSFQTATPLAVGSAAGGVLGSQIFKLIRAMFGNQNAAGAVQAGCLAVITAGTLVYAVYKQRIRTYKVKSKAVCLVIGTVLGLMSSFLGIGGGPINLVVLFFFFGMDTKAAAQNSLYIILFSQLANLLTTLVTRSVPQFDMGALVLMTAGGIGGGAAGRRINRKMDNKAVDRLLLCLTAVIICISIYNTWKYARLIL